MTLDDVAVNELLARLASGDAPPVAAPARRRPVHVVYGGAHLFRRDTARKLGDRALEALETYAGDASGFASAMGLGPDIDEEAIFARVCAKLEQEPVEDLRIDFEDGFGPRSHAEEDETAAGAARELVAGAAAGTLPEQIGIRIKSLAPETRRRALRTLDRFVTTLVDAGSGELPRSFLVTLPKVTRGDEVAVLAAALAQLESKLDLERGMLRIEIMVETVEALFDGSGGLALPSLIRAGDGRCDAAHFGAYDYTAALGVPASQQSLAHPACVLARQLMRAAAAHTGIDVSDGATTILPVAIHRGSDLDEGSLAENAARVRAAWRLHFTNVERAHVEGFRRGWDLHPAQLCARYAATYAFFARSFDADAARLRGFVDAAGRATLKGDVFDDAASALGLLNTFASALECGAATADEVEAATGLGIAEIRSRSFAAIVAARSDDGQ